ncbi:hypothetical protein D5Q94_15865 [Salmonella enterica subsp. diarizonae serovar 61:k:1,5,(7)]|nr:hypothetical protein [Salmonella enterica]EAW1958968.1 hypothetical protein [Salmonella enterica subsp. enterica]ECC9454593.1 hypothetical protein [Salmonella enterica subsp. diarizonae]ECT4110834.1 hypothetical protein [Salmonella enterica subsp. diarizonae serovar 61:k:1,5,(7)]ECU0281937.1 hypothetical protein [Salmonella enterica subsp. diarizonae serovar 61:k:1,5,7]
MAQHSHQLLATGARRVIIEKVELRYALAEEVTQQVFPIMVAILFYYLLKVQLFTPFTTCL